MHENGFQLHAQSAVIATVNTREFDCSNYAGFYLVLLTGARSGTITIDPTLQMKLADGSFVTLQNLGAPIAAAGTNVFYFGTPAVAAAGAPEVVVESHPVPLPKQCRFSLVAGGTGSWDVSCFIVPAI